MNALKLVKMANDMANFFDSESDKESAAEGIKRHLQKSWDPRMRKVLIRHAQDGGEGLSPLAAQAVKKLTE